MKTSPRSSQAYSNTKDIHFSSYVLTVSAAFVRLLLISARPTRLIDGIEHLVSQQRSPNGKAFLHQLLVAHNDRSLKENTGFHRPSTEAADASVMVS
ncbi:hypothetical protein ABEV41_01675 [Geobacillus thermodenitrificans]|uniref:hypothetical protein n=1 Tax=Geobacillus thermodenitrificans TaxID=33940 RepID=UPI003D21EC1F